MKSSLTKHETPLRIGIIAAAAINFTAIIDPVSTHPDAIITAIAARSKAKADAQIAKYNLATTCKAYGSYDELIADQSIEAVYIPLPNGLHTQWALKAMEAGKHVLIEKPIASNVDEARQIRDTATKTGKVALEAFHWRFHPAAHTVKALLESGKYGSPTSIVINMTLPSGIVGLDDIRFDYKLAGGASMDLTYVYSASSYFASPDPTKADHRVLEAKPRINKLDKNIDEAMESVFVIESPGKPPVTCHTKADLRDPWLFGLIPKIWKGTPSVTIETESAYVDLNNFAGPQYGHSITIKDKKTEKIQVEKCFVDGPQWGSRGKPWWTTYRYQLEAFVDMCRAKDQGREYHGPGMSMDESVKLMSLIDAVYEKAGLPKRGL